MSSTLTPSMNLIVPTIGDQAGPTYAENLNSDLSLLDSHDHSAGKGVAINPAGININSNLSMNNFNLTSITALTLTPTVISQANASLYVSGVDLYFKDFSGNAIQMTASGLVNATSSGISSGTATASFVAGALVVNAAALTPANIQGGSLLMGNNTASSNFLTLAPPTAMGSSFTITLPSLPASQKIMTLDASGNVGAAYVVDNSTIEVSSNTIRVKDLGITQAKKALRTTGTTVAAGGVAISGDSSGSLSVVLNTPRSMGASVTITTLGNPVLLIVGNQGTFTNTGSSFCSGIIQMDAAVGGEVSIYNGSSYIAKTGGLISGNGSGVAVLPASFHFIDTPAAGTYTYSLYINNVSGGTHTISWQGLGITAFEL